MIPESERRIKILEYVREHSVDSDQKQIKKVTKSDVMKHLKEVRPMTTHKTIVELIKEGKIKMVKDKPYSQTDYLVLNENNEFNKIYNSLIEIENSLDTFFELYHKMPSSTENAPKYYREAEGEFGDVLNDFFESYREAIDVSLKQLLVRAKSKIRSEKDKQILNSMIIAFQQKFMRVLDIREYPVNERLGHMIARLGHLEKRPFTRAKKYFPNLMNDIIMMSKDSISMLERLKQLFLT